MQQVIRILHLEDNADDVVMIAQLLKRQGISCTVTNVNNAKDFGREMEQGQVDVVLSDVALAGFDGLEALRLVLFTRPQTPVIFVTGTLTPKMREEMIRRGAAYCLDKNELSHLGTTVTQALQRASRKRVAAPVGI